MKHNKSEMVVTEFEQPGTAQPLQQKPISNLNKLILDEVDQYIEPPLDLVKLPTSIIPTPKFQQPLQMSKPIGLTP